MLNKPKLRGFEEPSIFFSKFKKEEELGSDDKDEFSFMDDIEIYLKEYNDAIKFTINKDFVQYYNELSEFYLKISSFEGFKQLFLNDVKIFNIEYKNIIHYLKKSHQQLLILLSDKKTLKKENKKLLEENTNLKKQINELIMGNKRNTFSEYTIL
jgi:hypothetical protein